MSCPLHSNDNSCAGCAKVKIKSLERKLEEARELLVKSNSQLDLTWYSIGCTVDDYAIKKLKSIYHRELDKLKEKGE